MPASEQKKTGRDAVFPQTWAAGSSASAAPNPDCQRKEKDNRSAGNIPAKQNSESEHITHCDGLRRCCTNTRSSSSSGSHDEGVLGKVVEEKVATDFLGDERSWKDWFASLTTAVIQMYPHLADAMEGVAVRAESIQDWNSLDDWIDGNVRDEYEGLLWAVLVQHTGGAARTVVLNKKMNQGKPDGFAALGMLASRFLHALTQLLSPPTVKGREAGSSDGGRVGSCEG